jgi:hypothetical protein
MDTYALVEEMIEEGRRFVAQLRLKRFDTTAAFWVKTSDEGRWFLYVASKAFDERGPAAAYRDAYSILREMQPSWLSMSEIKLVGADNPIARDVVALRDRHTGRIPARYRGPTVGNLTIEEAYIYPSGSARMTPAELLQTLISMSNRPKGTIVQPSVITLRDGSVKEVIIGGFHLQMPGGLTIQAIDPSSMTKSQIPGEEVVSIH